jgi:pyrroline-5-carboxylate reductase
MAVIAFLGAGNMAAAIINGMIKSAQTPPETIHAYDIDTKKTKTLKLQHNITIANDITELTAKADILILAVKPQNFPEILPQIKPHIHPETLVISIAAGIRTEKISAELGSIPIIRVMPNTPALISAGITAIFPANSANENHLESARKIFSAVGKTVTVQNEDQMDAVTALSGSGPAYFFLMMEKMIQAAAEMDLDPETAAQLVLNTAKGSAELAIHAHKNSQTPAQLRQKVTSKGGTTEAALNILNDANFGKTLIKAIKKAQKKSKQLSK